MALTKLVAEVPKPPGKCTGTKADAFWAKYIEWSETTAEVLDMLRRFELAVAIKANALGKTKAKSVLATANAAAATANEVLHTSIVDASKICALSAAKAKTPMPMQQGPTGVQSKPGMKTAPKGTQPKQKQPGPIQ